MRILIVLILFSSFSARAELFACNGRGRFAALTGKQFEVSPQKQGVEIFRSEKETVTLEVDDANSDGTHYLKIMVENSDGHTRTAKGSRRDMVMYIDEYAGVIDIVNCMPVPGT